MSEKNKDDKKQPDLKQQLAEKRAKRKRDANKQDAFYGNGSDKLIQKFTDKPKSGVKSQGIDPKLIESIKSKPETPIEDLARDDAVVPMQPVDDNDSDSKLMQQLNELSGGAESGVPIQDDDWEIRHGYSSKGLQEADMLLNDESVPSSSTPRSDAVDTNTPIPSGSGLGINEIKLLLEKDWEGIFTSTALKPYRETILDTIAQDEDLLDEFTGYVSENEVGPVVQKMLSILLTKI